MGPRFPLLLRILWFYFIGMPLGIIWLHVAWIAGITIIGLPICLWMINAAPRFMTLRQEGHYQQVQVGKRTAYIYQRAEQAGFFTRAVWFVLIGWWASLFWIELSILAAASFIGIPLAFWMINRLPFVMSLRTAS